MVVFIKKVIDSAVQADIVSQTIISTQVEYSKSAFFVDIVTCILSCWSQFLFGIVIHGTVEGWNKWNIPFLIPVVGNGRRSLIFRHALDFFRMGSWIQAFLTIFLHGEIAGSINKEHQVLIFHLQNRRKIVLGQQLKSLDFCVTWNILVLGNFGYAIIKYRFFADTAINGIVKQS